MTEELKNINEAIQRLENEKKTRHFFNEVGLGTAYTNRGLYYILNNKYEESIPDFDEGIKIMEKLQGKQELPDANELAKAYAGRGMAYKVLGVLNNSEFDLNRSIKIWENLKNAGKFVDDKILSLIYGIGGTPNDNMNENMLALTYMIKGVDFDKEEKFLEANQQYDKAIEIWERLHKKSVEIDNNEWAKTYMNRGANYYQTGEIDRALVDYNSGINIIKQFPIDWIDQNAFDAFMLYKSRGMAYEVIGNMEAAIYDNIAAQSVIKKVFSKHPEFHELYYTSLVEMIELIVKENDQGLFKHVIEEFLYSMRDVPKTKEAEEIQNSILEKINN